MIVAFSRRESTTAWLFVAVQFTLLGVMVLLPRDVAWIPSGTMRTVGMALLITGFGVGTWGSLYLGRGLTPSPLPNGATNLVTKGPYMFVRHPIYTTVMPLGLGITTRSGSLMVAVAFGALISLFNVKARWEEEEALAAEHLATCEACSLELHELRGVTKLYREYGTSQLPHDAKTRIAHALGLSD